MSITESIIGAIVLGAVAIAAAVGLAFHLLRLAITDPNSIAELFG